MLLKGHDEVRSSPRPHAAADMVLVRLAYAADLPTPGDLARLRNGSGAAGEDRKGGAAPTRKAPRQPAHASAEEPPPIEASPQEAAAPDHEPSFADPKSFEDLVALAGEKRDLKLKNALTEQVRLVRFRPGHLELNPVAQAPKELGQDLMRKLKAWTGRVWIVALSGEEGAAPLGQQRREREAKEIEAIRNHPQVKQVLDQFPGARIAAVRPAVQDDMTADNGDAADDAFKEDGTDP